MKPVSNIFDLQHSVDYINELKPIVKYDSGGDMM
jgi:hypothetical protein